MSNYKVINFSFFGIVLLIASVFPDLNLVSAKDTPSKATKIVPTLISNQDLLENIGNNQISQQAFSNQSLLVKIIKPIQQQTEDSIVVTDYNSALSKITNAESRLRLTKLISFSLFLLFFIPLGIFYPLFLFYRKLLSVEPKKPDFLDYSPEQNYKPKFTESQTPVIFDFPVKEDKDAAVATVSKLQIAFSPQALRLREKLEQISSHEDLDMYQDIADLMCKTVLALVSQQDWTHINYSSVSLPLEKVQEEFNLISQAERNKFLSKELSIVNQNKHQQVRENHDHHLDAYRYVVVTLVLRTTHNTPFFSKIYTEEQLIIELGKLGKMKKDVLIEFELLWNPQQNAQYLSNEQLLTKYSDMIRLL